VTSGANNIANFGLAAIQHDTLIHHSLSLVPISFPKTSVPVHFTPITISIKTTENPTKHWTDFSKCSNSNPKANLTHQIFNVLHYAIQFFPSITHSFSNHCNSQWDQQSIIFHTTGIEFSLPSPHKEEYTLKTMTTPYTSTVKYTYDSGQFLEVQIFTKLFSDTDMPSP